MDERMGGKGQEIYMLVTDGKKKIKTEQELSIYVPANTYVKNLQNILLLSANPYKRFSLKLVMSFCVIHAFRH